MQRPARGDQAAARAHREGGRPREERGGRMRSLRRAAHAADRRPCINSRLAKFYQYAACDLEAVGTAPRLLIDLWTVAVGYFHSV